MSNSFLYFIIIIIISTFKRVIGLSAELKMTRGCPHSSPIFFTRDDGTVNYIGLGASRLAWQLLKVHTLYFYYSFLPFPLLFNHPSFCSSTDKTRGYVSYLISMSITNIYDDYQEMHSASPLFL